MSQTITPAVKVSQANVAATASYLNASFFERSAIVDLALTAMVAGEHVALIGPPGTAKSAVFNELSKLVGSKHFVYLLTRFTEPNEVFGPVDINEFKTHGKYVRKTTNMLPEAETVFLDEAFKANSAILNALLTLMNERLFDNGGQRLATPNHSFFLASNELPTDPSLGALWDRCLLRTMVNPIADEANWVSLCFGEGTATMSKPTITMDDFRALGQHAQTLKFSPKVVEACRGIKSKLAEKSITVSDRRWVKATKTVLRAFAAYKGGQEVTEEHVDILRYVLWERPEQIPVIEGVVEEFAAAWLAIVREMAAKLDEAQGRLNNARAMGGGARLRALADVADLIEPLVGEAVSVHKTYNRRETEGLIKRAEQLTNDATNAARAR